MAWQLGTEDQGWVAHFVMRALGEQPITIYGDGRQVRDVLYVDDAVEAYVHAWKALARAEEGIGGRAFNLGGGPANAVSLLQLVERLEVIVGRKVAVRFEDWRGGDQRYFVADSRRASRQLSLSEPTPWRTGLGRLSEWLASEMPKPSAQSRQSVEA